MTPSPPRSPLKAVALLALLPLLALAACGPAPPDPTGPPESFVAAVIENLGHIARPYVPDPGHFPDDYPATAAYWTPMVAEMRELVAPHLASELLVDWRSRPVRQACLTAWFHLTIIKMFEPPAVVLLKEDDAASLHAVLRVDCFDSGGAVEARYRIELVRREGRWKLLRAPRWLGDR